MFIEVSRSSDTVPTQDASSFSQRETVSGAQIDWVTPSARIRERARQDGRSVLQESGSFAVATLSYENSFGGVVRLVGDLFFDQVLN